MHWLLNVAPQSVHLPLVVNLGLAAQREAVELLVVAQIGEHRLHGGDVSAVSGSAFPSSNRQRGGRVKSSILTSETTSGLNCQNGTRQIVGSLSFVRLHSWKPSSVSPDGAGQFTRDVNL
jgi:hypothetical protein